MTERAPYSRVYWEIVDDPKFETVYDNDHALALWLRLLLAADQAHPASGTLPAGSRKSAVVVLVEARLITVTGSRFRIVGLDAERGKRTETARNASASRWHTDRIKDPNASGMPRQDETRRGLDETSQDEQTARATRDDLWSDPEGDALVWLARHGCDVRPGNGYHRKLVTATEQYGVNAIVGMFDRLVEAGTHNGDTKGFLFGAIDALDSRHRPKVSELEAEDRAGERKAAHRRRLEQTRRETADLRAVLDAKP
jgi:hypothetical protein